MHQPLATRLALEPIPPLRPIHRAGTMNVSLSCRVCGHVDVAALVLPGELMLFRRLTAWTLTGRGEWRCPTCTRERRRVPR